MTSVQIICVFDAYNKNNPWIGWLEQWTICLDTLADHG